jgi:indole-3-glycerol phosphate synthase
VTDSYVKTGTFLDKILEHKVEEIAALRSQFDLATVIAKSAENFYTPRDFAGALKQEAVALIAEVKKASPSKGVLIEDFDPVAIGKTYAENGASAISVLTDKEFFQGDLIYLNRVRDVVDVPVLRKDFIIDPFQIHFMRATRIKADAMLLIVATLEDAQLADLYGLISALGMTALVEVHDETEMERALRLGARVIGVNNRDLKTFEVDLNTTARLASMTPEDVILVAESGIRNGADVRRMGELGANAVLVGEHLVKSADMGAMVREMSGQVIPTN